MPIVINSWRGDSQAIPQVTRVTIPSVASEDQVFTLTINLKDVEASGASASDVYEAWFNAWSSTTNPVPAEFAELTPSLEGEADAYTALILTGEEDGRPFEISGSSSSDNPDITVSTTQTGVAALNEIQRFSFTATGGTYTLEFDGQVTGAIAYDAVAATIQTALEALSNIAVGDVTVSGTNPFNVEFKLAYAATDVGLLIGNGTSLTGAVSIAISETRPGSGATNSTWEIAFALSSTATGTYFVHTPEDADSETVVINALDTQATVQAAFEAAVGAGNVVVIRSTSSSQIIFTVEFTGIYAGIECLLSSIGSAFPVEETQAGSATGVDELQDIQFSGSPTGGTFKLTFRGQETSALAYNISAADLKTALEALTTITTVTVTKISTYRWRVEFGLPRITH
jgi:trimeric autotransporter adhesin